MHSTEENQIRYLLVKYFEGNTTLEEENILADYFSTNYVSTEFLPLKKQFKLIKQSRSLACESDGLESSILHVINEYEQQAHPTLVKRGFARYLAAASIAVIVGISGFWLYRIQNNQIRDTYTDPKLAYIETQNALLLISQKMNKGIEPLSNITKINTGSSQLKNIRKMDESLGMLNLVSFINNSSNLKK